jgi:MFS family permease
MATAETSRPARAVFAYPNFSRYQAARFSTVLATEMQAVAVGWQVYELTRRPLSLGLVGLAQFFPAFALFLVAGQVIDRFPRNRILLCCYSGFATCSALLMFLTYRGIHSMYPIYLVLVLSGAVRSFHHPTSQAFLPQIVDEDMFPTAVAWQSSFNQAANIGGPALGGVIYAVAHGPMAVYALALAASLSAIINMSRVHPINRRVARRDVNWNSLLAGIKFVWNQKVVLGTISLDLFAVLLGGAVALLPIYAREILRTGPWGLGLLRSGPAMGAALMALLLAHRPLRRPGATMMWCVAGFGVATIVFGLSRNIALSLLALFFVGATDMVSIVVRNSLVQLSTPDEMRGRVSAVNSLFIGASNEFGQFESGVTAQWFGAVPAVVLGGVGTLVVIGIWARIFPELRRAKRTG